MNPRTLSRRLHALRVRAACAAAGAALASSAPLFAAVAHPSAPTATSLAPAVAPAPTIALVPRATSVPEEHDPRALAAALESVRAENIRADIFFIASDDLGGRDTPSAGLEIAARYIRSRLERLHWQPGAGDEYFYRYPLRQRALDETASEVRIERGGTTEVLRFGREYFIPAVLDLADLSTSGAVVFCGTGSSDDFEAAQGVNGAWALCYDAGGETAAVAKRAKQAGAVGLVLAPGPEYKGDLYAERFAKTLARQRKAPVSFPGKERGGDRDVYPTVMVGREGLACLLGGAQDDRAPAGALTVGTKLDLVLTESRKLVGTGGTIRVENVCGLWPGSDPELKKQVILVTAHYDHVGTRDGVVYNGADDNGSGTCGLLAIAEALAQYGPMRRTVMLMWVSGEEKGLWGSRAWSEHPLLPDDHHAIADINIDMVGRNAPDKMLITPTREREADYNGLVRMAEALSPSEGFPKLESADEYYTRSDHFNFAKLGIPVAFLFSDVHEDYHGPGDDPEKIDCDKVRRTMRLVVRMLDALQADRLTL